MSTVRYKRVLLKLSGEVLAGDQGFGIDPPVIGDVARQIREMTGLGVPKSTSDSSVAIIDACRPYHWIDKYPPTTKISAELLRKTEKEWGEILRKG